MSGPTITAALITLNEERALPELLSRLHWVDEIVIVDGGSTDRTAALARAAATRFVQHPFDDFARQRNRALDLAGGDWVLSIDADERPTEAFIAEVRARITVADRHAYRVPIQSTIFGRAMRFGGTQDDYPVRLFRRGHARWTGAVHERLSYDGPARRMRYGLDHQTLPGLRAFLAKMHRYTELEARSRVARGQRPRTGQRWLAPAAEFARRLVWKRGFLDGPEGWAFAFLSGVSEWVLTQKQERFWAARAMNSVSRETECQPVSRETDAGLVSRETNAGPVSRETSTGNSFHPWRVDESVAALTR